MKKFSFYCTALAITTISLFLFSACNKQDSELEETAIQNELDKFKDYEKFVSLFRLTTESAKELIDFHSKLQPTGSEDYNNYVKEIVNSSPEQIIERQNKAIQKTLKSISTQSVAELDNMIKEIVQTKNENATQTESSIQAQSRSSLGMTFGGSVFGVPAAASGPGLYYILNTQNSGNYILTADILIPATPMVDGERMDLIAAHTKGVNNFVCYDGLYITMALQQPSSNASRSAFYFGGGGYWGGASFNIPSYNHPGHVIVRTLFINGTCSNVEPHFGANFGQQTGCIGTNSNIIAAPVGTIYCN